MNKNGVSARALHEEIHVLENLEARIETSRRRRAASMRTSPRTGPEETRIELTPRLEAPAMQRDRAAVGVDILTHRVCEAESGLRIERGAQARHVIRQQIVVVVEKVEPVATRGFERDVRGLGAFERAHGRHETQRERAAGIGHRAMRRVGRDDDDFEVR